MVVQTPLHMGGGGSDHSAASASSDESFAIVGMGCRLPGSATSPEKLWELISAAKSAWTPEPPDGRWKMSQFYDPQVGKMGSLFTKGAHFLKQDIGLFDRQFFNISATEATAMDPQIRLLLEIAFETFENAGYSMQQLAHSQTGVFVGAWSRDYQVHLERDPENAPMYQSTGTSSSIVSNRISHFFDLNGPSFTVDTACSSSLVALHQALLSIQNGDADCAFVGGVNLIIDPTTSMALGRMRLLSPDGRSYAFDQRANGYGRGEGVGGILIKPLSAAIRDGDSIRAIIRSSATNQDGQTPGITLPSGPAQVRAIERAYNARSLKMEADFVECHGTGTAAGDPIETKAIATALTKYRTSEDPMLIGSIKSSIGHLEAAAGIASVIKSVLMLEKGLVPPQALLQNETKAIDFQGLKIKPANKLHKPEKLERISINSFGFGGANAHMVLEKANTTPKENSTQTPSAASSTHQKPCLAIISGATEKGCKLVAAQLSKFIVDHPELEDSATFPQDLAYSLSKRSLLQHRAAFVYHDIPELLEKLDLVQCGTLPIERASPKSGLTYVFTGQGAQWFAMGRELLEYAPFRKLIDEASAIFKKHGCAWDLVEELSKSEVESRVSEPSLSQPISTAIQICVVSLMKSLGISPTAVVGHSSGEIAAAFTANAVDFEDALIGAYYRGFCVGEAIGRGTMKGCMMAVGLNAAKTEEYIAQLPQEAAGTVIVACHNSPSSVTVSGDEEYVVQLHKILQNESVFSRLLKTNGAAYHSHHMQPVAKDLSKVLAQIKPGKVDESIHWVSSVTAADQAGEELTGEYWVRNLVSPVLFPQALEKICRSKATPTTIVEIGPHSALAGPIKQTLKPIGMVSSVKYTNVLTRGQNAADTFLAMVGTLAVRGEAVDLSATHKFFGYSEPTFVKDLPSYPWDHDTKYWHDSRFSTEYRSRSVRRHELLGVRSPDFSLIEPSWRNYVRLSEVPWLKGHAVHGQAVWPGAGFVALAIEATRQVALAQGQLAENPRYVLRDVIFSRALVLREDADDTEIIYKMRPLATSANDSSKVWNEFRVLSLSKNSEPQEHCRGLIAAESSKVPHVPVFSDRVVKDIEANSPMQITASDFYRTMRGLGMGWTEAFSGMTGVMAGADSAVCTLKPYPTTLPQPAESALVESIHPGTLDIWFQATFATLFPQDRPATRVVTGFDELDLTFSGSIKADEDLKIVCQTTNRGYDVASHPDKTTPFDVRIKGCRFAEIAGEGDDEGADQQTVFNLKWQPMSSEALASTFGIQTSETTSEQSAPATNGTAPTTNGDVHPPAMTNGFHHEEKVLNSSAPTSEALLKVEQEAVRPQLQLLGNIKDALLPVLAEELRNMNGSGSVEVQNWDTVSAPDETCIILDSVENPLLLDLKEERFLKFQDLIKAATNLLWLTVGATENCSNPELSTVSGFASTIRVENPALRLVTVDVDSTSAQGKDLALVISQILKGKHFDAEAEASSFDFDLAYHEGQWLVSRVVVEEKITTHLIECGSNAESKDAPYFPDDTRPMRLAPGQPGLLDSLRWEDQENTNLSPKEDEVVFETRAHGVNFRDLLVAMGQLGSGPDAVMAGECAGVITAVGSKYAGEFTVGDRVCAFGAQPYANIARVPGHRCLKIPDNVTYEVAATIPIVGSTVAYALLHLGQIEKGSKVLIHSATGGVGQAAVMLAQHIGAEVFATVGNADKRKLLTEEFGVPEDHIFSSRDTNFKHQIMSLTDGYGVDMVLNSLSGELFRESCNCLADFGKFVEIGKRDLQANSKMDMRFFLKSASFTAMDLMVIGEKKPRLCKTVFAEAMDFVASGKIKPIKIMSAPISDVSNVFRQMQAGKHVGKIVLTSDKDSIVKVVPRKSSDARFKSNASYLIIGGLGGLGQTMIRWMAKKGAKHIITMSRSGLRNESAQSLVKEMHSQGVFLHVLECDASNAASVQSSLDSLEGNIPSVKGIFQAAMVLQDSIFENMAYSQWAAATQPKIQGTQNLHKYFESRPLDFFITLSSVVAVVGNPGQGAYGAANSYLDGLARHRTANKASFPGTSHSINVGVVSDAGVVSQNSDLARTLASRGYCTITVKDLLNVMDYVVANPDQFSSTETAQTIMGLGTDARALRGPKFSNWLEVCGAAAEADAAGSGAGQLDLRLAGSPAEALTIATAALSQQLAKLLSIDAATVEAGQTLSSYGIDSLISVELRNWIRADLKAQIPLLEINKSGRTVGDLAEMVAQKSTLCQGL